MSDPVAEKFGKDLAALIHFQAHKAKLRILRQDYFDHLLCFGKDDSLVFKACTDRGHFFFNYRDARVLDEFDAITTWNRPGGSQWVSLPKNW